MRIAVTGQSGQVVSALIERGTAAGHEILALGRPTLDLAITATIEPALTAAKPDLIVSAAAYTAVDKAETDMETAQAVNAVGAGEIARTAQALGIPVIHLSTDYVFDGLKSTPYVETDPTGPLGVYGATKLLGEQRVAAATPNHVILRLAWIYSPFGANFVKTMLRLSETRDALGVVADQQGGPTSALDIADAILIVAAKLVADSSSDLRGVFHLAPTGTASWAEFAEAIFRGAARRGGKDCSVRHITTAEYSTPARRPQNSRLSGEKLARVYGISLPAWTQSLDLCLDRLLQRNNR